MMGKPCLVSASSAGTYLGGYVNNSRRSVEVVARYSPPRPGWVVGCSHIPVGSYSAGSYSAGSWNDLENEGEYSYLVVDGAVPVLRVQFDVHMKSVYARMEDVEIINEPIDATED